MELNRAETHFIHTRRPGLFYLSMQLASFILSMMYLLRVSISQYCCYDSAIFVQRCTKHTYTPRPNNNESEQGKPDKGEMIFMQNVHVGTWYRICCFICCSDSSFNCSSVHNEKILQLFFIQLKCAPAAERKVLLAKFSEQVFRIYDVMMMTITLGEKAV